MKVNRLINSTIGAACILLAATTLYGADQMNIWPDDSPELKGVATNHFPTLQLFPGPKGVGKKPAILICPAGGYKGHAVDMEEVKWMNSLGMAVYSVNYRIPARGPKGEYGAAEGYAHPAPLHDAQRAMRIIRKNAEEWGVDATKVGVFGGSSGGHVASTLATHYDQGDKTSKDPVEQQGCRPDFVMLFEPVITMQGKDCHFHSRGRLIGIGIPRPDNLSKEQNELIDNLSNEKQVTPDTPPAFVVVSGQDRLVPAENGLMFFMALRANRVALSELHFFSHGGHAYQEVGYRDLMEGWWRRLEILPVKEGEKPWDKQFDKGAWEEGNYQKGVGRR